MKYSHEAASACTQCRTEIEWIILRVSNYKSDLNKNRQEERDNFNDIVNLDWVVVRVNYELIQKLF